jgi:hypothetical protein
VFLDIINVKRSITEKERALGNARANHAASLAERDAALAGQQLHEWGADSGQTGNEGCVSDHQEVCVLSDDLERERV